MEFISKRDSKKILLENNLPLAFLDGYVLVSKNNRISIVSRDVAKLNLDDFRIISAGLPISCLIPEN